jgi:pimeloyl-ACP methyl ester carboxylesterase
MRARQGASRKERHEVGIRITLAIVLALAGLAFSAAGAAGATKFQWIAGYDDPATPDDLDRVGILKVGPKKAPNVLVLNPGTSASAAYFRPLAKLIAREADGWQVWAVERRENQLEDHSVVDAAKSGTATPQELFDYYLGYLTDPGIDPHYQTVQDSSVQFARGWGMQVEIEDLRRVVLKASKLGGEVVVGGHSLGGTITTAYATWDFNGRPGARGLSGLVYIDGASRTTPIGVDDANVSLAELDAGSPWLSFGGIAAPLAGLFNVVASTGVLMDPNGVGALQDWPLLPAYLKAPVPTTNVAAYGYALDTETSPSSLVAAQAHLGRLAASGDPRGWDQAGELTPILRYARMFSGTGVPGHDGTAWYHPMRLTIDSGAVGNGVANPAQDVLGVRAIHGADLPRKLRMLAFGGSLGGQRVLDSTSALASQSGIPRRQLSLTNRATTYSHNDPNSAYPKNAFVAKLIPFLGKVARG